MAKQLILIAAMDDEGLLGYNNKMPWSIPHDLLHFKTVTMGNPVVMGRKTFNSLVKPLPGRSNIVVTRQLQEYDINLEPNERGTALYWENDLEAGLQTAFALSDRVFVIGGAEIYNQTIDRADELFITKIEAQYVVPANVVDAAYFPDFMVSTSDWELLDMQIHRAVDHLPGYSFNHYVRVTGA